MMTFKTITFSALALGALASGFTSSYALADHRDGRGRGYGKQVVDVYIDAHHDPRLEGLIARTLREHNPYVNVVNTPRYADVTIRVNGILARPEIYDRARDRRGAVAVMGYDYRITFETRRGRDYSERIRGEVSQPLGGRYGYYPNSGGAYEKAERAIEIFGIFLETVTGDDYAEVNHSNGRDWDGRDWDDRDWGDGRGGRYERDYDYRQLERALSQEAYREIAYRIAHMDIPQPKGRRW